MDGEPCFIAAVVAEKVMKCDKLGIAIAGEIWYYKGATQIKYCLLPYGWVFTFW